MTRGGVRRGPWPNWTTTGDALRCTTGFIPCSSDCLRHRGAAVPESDRLNDCRTRAPFSP